MLICFTKSQNDKAVISIVITKDKVESSDAAFILSQ